MPVAPGRIRNGITFAIRRASTAIGADDPDAMADRWRTLGIDEAVRFVPAGARGEGVDGVTLLTTDPARAGEQRVIGGVTFTLASGGS